MDAASRVFIPRTTIACEACRIRKRKCDGNSPCSFCVFKQQECSFVERKKRGPKKRNIECVDTDDTTAIVPVVSPSPLELEMSDKAEAITYLDSCYKHLHRIHSLSSNMKVRHPNSISQKVQAYATYAYTARLCGAREKSQIYINQARTLAGQIFDCPDADTVSGLLLMSYYSTLAFDLPRATYYATLGTSLAKMIPKDKLDYRLFAFCQTTAIMTDASLSGEEKSDKFHELFAYLKKIKTSDKMMPMFLCLTELNRTILHLFDHSVFYDAPNATANVFDILDRVVVDEASRLRMFEAMDNIIAAAAATHLASHMGFVHRLLLPLLHAVVNWRSGHVSEAMEYGLKCFACLQLLDNDKDCLFGLLSHLPQIYLLGSLVKMFLEQGQAFLARQMSELIKRVCYKVKPDLDTICHQMDKMILSHHTDSPSPPSPPSYSSPPSSSSSSSPSSSLSPYHPPPSPLPSSSLSPHHPSPSSGSLFAYHSLFPSPSSSTSHPLSFSPHTHTETNIYTENTQNFDTNNFNNIANNYGEITTTFYVPTPENAIPFYPSPHPPSSTFDLSSSTPSSTFDISPHPSPNTTAQNTVINANVENNNIVWNSENVLDINTIEKILDLY